MLKKHNPTAILVLHSYPLIHHHCHPNWAGFAFLFSLVVALHQLKQLIKTKHVIGNKDCECGLTDSDWLFFVKRSFDSLNLKAASEH